ncbi:MAG: hypothetical protein IJ224_01520 [Lachnospiraceae bacterium]|nr:hypothetical protein [Lachnospiraceae bacterium]
MDKNNKIIKINRDIKFNIASAVVACAFLYVVITLIISLKKEPVTTYNVNKTDINNNIIIEGLAVREELVLNSEKSGYVCYYIRDGEKIMKNSMVCTIDETGQVYNTISDSESYDGLLTSNDYNEVRDLISLYKISYKDSSFYNAYNFENNLNNKVLELTNEVLMQQVGQSSGNSLAAISSPESGLVTYYIDGYENYNISNVNKSDFDKSNYKKDTLKTGDIISAGTPVVKIVPSEKWNIILPITDDQAAAINSVYSEEGARLVFKINNSSYDISMPFEIIYGNDGKYLNITLDKFMLNYMSERFVTVEIILEDDTGLKVPVSALTQKEVYQIPIGYLSGGGNQSNNNKLNVQVMGKDNEITIKQVSPMIYKTDEEYCYVDPLAFDDTDVIIDIDTNETIAVSVAPRVNIEGVYSANRGIAEFRMVTVIKTMDDFALVKSDEELNIYDNIILDSSKVHENQIIY